MAYYGLDNLDARIAEHITATNGTFVELGAYDGITQNNTLHFEEKGWRGILIEPVPAAYAACVRNRPLARVFNCACVPGDYCKPTVKMTAVGLMSLVSGIMDDQTKEDAWITRGEEIQQIHRTAVTAPARTLDSILVEAQLLRPDLLVLDVEGAEVMVLRGLDFERHRPRFIVSEDIYSSDVTDFLSSKGYSTKAVLLQRRFTRDVLYIDHHVSTPGR